MRGWDWEGGVWDGGNSVEFRYADVRLVGDGCGLSGPGGGSRIPAPSGAGAGWGVGSGTAVVKGRGFSCEMEGGEKDSGVSEGGGLLCGVGGFVARGWGMRMDRVVLLRVEGKLTETCRSKEAVAMCGVTVTHHGLLDMGLWER